ncbi:hypothetical protein ACFQZ4_18550 [Catellatospora coxensis]
MSDEVAAVVPRDEDGVRRSVEHMAMMLADMGFPDAVPGADDHDERRGDLADRR